MYKEKLAILSTLGGGVGGVSVGACDSRYIQTPDPYLDRLSDKSGHARLRLIASNVGVSQRLAAWPPATVHGPKAKGARVGEGGGGYLTD